MFKRKKRATGRYYLYLSLLVSFLSASANLSSLTKAPHTIGGNITVLIGETATLPCTLFATTESLTQISWQRKTRGKPVNDNFLTIVPDKFTFINGKDLRFNFSGNFTAYNGSLQLADVSLEDEGLYSCIFTLFPSGNFPTEIHLNVFVRPDIIIKDNIPLLGNEEVSLATCTAAHSKPPAEVKWNTNNLGSKVKATTNFTQHANGTTTTVSSLFGIPTRDIYQDLLTCVVTSPAQTEATTLPFKLQVYFSPTEVNISVKSQNTFECLSEANPSSDFAWTRPGQSWPQSAVSVEGATLQLLSVTSEVNGLYQCEVSNQYGKKHGHLYVYVTSGTCTACWVLFWILILILLAIYPAVWLYKHIIKPRGEVPLQHRQMAPMKDRESGEEGEESEVDQLQPPTPPRAGQHQDPKTGI